MSTWTFEVMRRGVRPAILLGAVCALSGCLGETPGGGPGFLAPSKATGSEVTRKAALGGGAVVIAPPDGYCIDAASVANRPFGGFALVASCESLTGRRFGVEVTPAVLTVSVTSRSDGRAQPQASLLADALPDGVPLRVDNGDGLTVVHVEGAGGLPDASGDARHWRGVMVVNDRLVGLALYGAKGSPIAGEAGERLLVSVAEGIRENSPMVAAVPQPAGNETAPAEGTKTGQRGGIATLFGRLFP